MKVIIVGCGRSGSQVALRLIEQGNHVTIIDKNPLAFERLDGNEDVSLVIGTGIDYDILESAGINEADAVLAVTKGDNTNIMIGQIAKFIFKVPNVVVRIVDPKVKNFYKEEVGLNCYCHTEVSSEHYLGMLNGEEKVCILL